MDRFAIVFGLALCGLTVVALFALPAKTPIQFVPMMLGIPTLFCGVVSLNPHRRRAAMRLAAVTGGVGATVGGVKSAILAAALVRGEPVSPVLFGVVLAMTVLCALLLLSWCVGRPRRWRGKSAAQYD